MISMLPGALKLAMARSVGYYNQRLKYLLLDHSDLLRALLAGINQKLKPAEANS
jgi:hypothetical protein